MMKRIDIWIYVAVLAWLFAGVVFDVFVVVGLGRALQYAFNAVAIFLMAAIVFRMMKEDDNDGDCI